MHATHLVVLVGAGNEGCEYARLATTAYAPHLLDTIHKYPEHQIHKEEKSTHNVAYLVKMTLSNLLRFLLHIFDAGEAAIVVMVVAMKCASVPSKRKCESLRILLVFLCAQGVVFV